MIHDMTNQIIFMSSPSYGRILTYLINLFLSFYKHYCLNKKETRDIVCVRMVTCEKMNFHILVPKGTALICFFPRKQNISFIKYQVTFFSFKISIFFCTVSILGSSVGSELCQMFCARS